MKIVTPLPNIASYEPLVRAGADEFYCGYVPFQWLESYSNVLPLNGRAYLALECNFSSLSSLKILRKMVDHYGVPVKFTFNAHYYLESQYPMLLEIMKQLTDNGFNTFIMADTALIIYLQQQGLDCKIHLSGEFGAANHMAVSKINRGGINRVVFPRKTRINHMKTLIQKVDNGEMEYEAFIVNGMCQYSGAYCNTIHCDEMYSACLIPYRCVRIDPDSSQFEDTGHALDVQQQFREEEASEASAAISRGKIYEAPELGAHGCGLCKIKELMDIGVGFLKVVGRERKTVNLANDIKGVKEIIRLAENAGDRTSFEEKIKEKYFNNRCPEICYYPPEA